MVLVVHNEFGGQGVLARFAAALQIRSVQQPITLYHVQDGICFCFSAVVLEGWSGQILPCSNLELAWLASRIAPGSWRLPAWGEPEAYLRLLRSEIGCWGRKVAAPTRAVAASLQRLQSLPLGCKTPRFGPLWSGALQNETWQPS